MTNSPVSLRYLAPFEYQLLRKAPGYYDPAPLIFPVMQGEAHGA